MAVPCASRPGCWPSLSLFRHLLPLEGRPVVLLVLSWLFPQVSLGVQLRAPVHSGGAHSAEVPLARGTWGRMGCPMAALRYLCIEWRSMFVIVQACVRVEGVCKHGSRVYHSCRDAQVCWPMPCVVLPTVFAYAWVHVHMCASMCSRGLHVRVHICVGKGVPRCACVCCWGSSACMLTQACAPVGASHVSVSMCVWHAGAHERVCLC